MHLSGEHAAKTYARDAAARGTGVIALLVGLVFWSLSASGQGQTLADRAERPVASYDCEGPKAALDVSAERMTFDSATQAFIFEEKVQVRRCAMTILCDRLQVIHNAQGNSLQQVVATGNVHFQDDQRQVTAERADYYEIEQKLVLVGSPRAWDAESNELTGEEIVIFLREERMLVKRAHVRFHPRQSSPGTP